MNSILNSLLWQRICQKAHSAELNKSQSDSIILPITLPITISTSQIFNTENLLSNIHSISGINKDLKVESKNKVESQLENSCIVNRNWKNDFQPGITVGYTYEAFFASDQSYRRRKYSENNTVFEENYSNFVQTESQDVCGKNFACPECGNTYATSSNLSRHRQTHRSINSQQAKKCPHCNKVYVSTPALSMHILTHNMKHKCDICGKLFSRTWLLQGHRRAHTGEKPYGCAHCGRAFSDRSNLRAHIQIHSERKMFQCDKCGKNFALKSYLMRHSDTCCSFSQLKNEESSQIIQLSTGSHLSFGIDKLLS